MSNKESSVYAPPKNCSFDPVNVDELKSDGNCVVMREETLWPRRCYRCNRATDTLISLKFKSVPNNAFLLILALIAFFRVHLGGFSSLVSIIILILGLTSYEYWLGKTVEISIPVCNKHEGRQRRLAWGWAIFCFLMLVAIFISASWHFFMSVVFLFVFVVVFFILSVCQPSLRVVKKDNGLIWINGTGKAFRDSLPPLY